MAQEHWRDEHGRMEGEEYWKRIRGDEGEDTSRTNNMNMNSTTESAPTAMQYAYGEYAAAPPAAGGGAGAYYEYAAYSNTTNQTPPPPPPPHHQINTNKDRD